MEERLRVLFVSAEVSPFARTGGLGDVVGALPPILASHGLDVRIAMPLYQAVRERSFSLTPVLQNLRVPLIFGDRTTHILQSHLGDRAGGNTVYFIEQDEYFARPGLYDEGAGDYEDNAFRFMFFCAAVLALVERLEWFPHIIHCHDWHTGLVSAYLRFLPWPAPQLATAATVYTIHNLAYQGVFPASIFGATGLPSRLFRPTGMEFYGNGIFMKA
ncbi:MAG: glycogen synthase, partial [Candidatus Binatia bacterium]